MNGTYILVGKKVVEEPDPLKWGVWMQTADRALVQISQGDVRISTVFLGLDHSFGEGPPVLWETMIFGGKHDGYQERYTSSRDAVLGHHEACCLVWGKG